MLSPGRVCSQAAPPPLGQTLVSANAPIVPAVCWSVTSLPCQLQGRLISGVIWPECGYYIYLLSFLKFYVSENKRGGGFEKVSEAKGRWLW